MSFKDKYQKYKLTKDDKEWSKKGQSKIDVLLQDKYLDLLNCESQVETILKDFASIDTIGKNEFIEINNAELKESLIIETTDIRNNIKELIRNKFKNHIEGINQLLKDIKEEFKEPIDYPQLREFSQREHNLMKLITQKKEYNELYENYN